MKRRKEATEGLIDQNARHSDAKKSKQETRVEKHTRLLAYLEEKQLREELDSIDGWQFKTR